MAERVLTERAAQWLEDMPPYYREDRFVWAVLNALSAEYERIEEASAALLEGGFPLNATDTYRLLGLWELQLGLPVEPPTTLAARQRAVRGHLARRRASSEADWYTAMSERLGNAGWSYEVASGGVLVHMPVNADEASSQSIMDYARQITPAHLALAFDFGHGFIFDSSLFDFGTF